MEPRARRWIRSSHSDTGAATCVEAAEVDGGVLLRDSKRASGPRVTISGAAWQRFLDATTADSAAR